MIIHHIDTLSNPRLIHMDHRCHGWFLSTKLYTIPSSVPHYQWVNNDRFAICEYGIRLAGYFIPKGVTGLWLKATPEIEGRPHHSATYVKWDEYGAMPLYKKEWDGMQGYGVFDGGIQRWWNYVTNCTPGWLELWFDFG